MTGLYFLAVTLGAAVVALLLRPLRGAALGVGLVGLVAGLAIASRIEEGGGLRIGDVALVGTAYARTVLVLATGCALVTFILGRADDEPPSHAPAALAVLGGLGAALLVDDPIVALLLVLGAGIAGVLVVLGGEAPSASAVAAAMRSLRAVVIAGALSIGAAAWLARPLGILALEPAVFGAAYLAMVGAVALRAGAVPFHLWLARLADSAPPAALPVFAVWVPVVLAVVALGWVDRSIAPILVPLETERAVVVAVGIASLGLGALAAWLAEDLVHVAVYVAVAETGLALLGLTVFDPGIWQPLRSWLVVIAVVETALCGWVAAARAGTGSRRVADLRGVLLEARGLRVALAFIALAAVGLPGWPIWDARARIVGLAVGGSFGGLTGLVEGLALLPFVALLRIAVVGMRGGSGGARPGVLRAGGAPGWRGSIRGRWSGSPFDSLRWEAARDLGGALRSGLAARRIEAGWRRNRVRVASLGALALALLAVAGSAGWLGIETAAAAGPPSLEQPEPIGGGLEGAP